MSAHPEDGDLDVGPPSTSAAGLTGVIKGLAPVLRAVGIRRGVRILRDLNQRGGVDCPGCAWPEPAHASFAEFCENGAKAIAEEATRDKADPAFFARHSIADLSRRSDHWLGSQGRITEPMVRRRGATHYESIGWDEAFSLVADRLRATDPNRAVFYTSGRTSNEAAFAYQLLVRQYGTNNMPDCSNMCHESSGSALGETIGIGKGSVSIEDFEQASVILVVGQNPGTNHPRMLTTLEAAKRAGATIVAINPMPEAGLLAFKNPQRLKGVLGRATTLADRYLQIRVGGDHALFQLINAALVRSGHVDQDFIADHTDGFDALAESLTRIDHEALLEATGLTQREVDDLAHLLGANDRIIACWAMGLTQHKASVPTIQELVNTILLRGAIGKPGAGVCPVRGHSNVQGDRTMGIWEKPSPEFLDALDAEFGIESPRAHGLDTVEAITAMGAGDVDVFVGMGGNLVSAAPDTDVTAAAMARCGLTVQVSTKLNRSHVTAGREALILPCLGRTEIDRTGGLVQRVTVEDSMGEVHASEGSVEPASTSLRSEVAIVSGLGVALAADGPVPWADLAADYARIRSRIQSVIPGFDDFETRIADGGRIRLPHPPRDDREFRTATGRARLTVNTCEPIEIPDGHLLLQTVRSHDQYNTTIYGLDDRYRGITGGRRVVFVHEDDLRALGLLDGTMVDLVSRWTDGVERRAKAFRTVEYSVARRTAAAYFPEANAVVPLRSTADTSNTPTSKSVLITLERHQG